MLILVNLVKKIFIRILFGFFFVGHSISGSSVLSALV